jgi:hypothetical protein
VIECELRVADCVRDFGVPQPTEWQRIGNQIEAAVIRSIKTILARFVAQRMAVSAPLIRKGDKSPCDTAI